jgi:hypothetical protein
LRSGVFFFAKYILHLYSSFLSAIQKPFDCEYASLTLASSLTFFFASFLHVDDRRVLNLFRKFR